MDAELVEGVLVFELGGGSGENAMAVISEGLQLTKRHRWTEKLVRSNGAVRSIRSRRIFFGTNSRQRESHASDFRNIISRILSYVLYDMMHGLPRREWACCFAR